MKLLSLVLVVVCLFSCFKTQEVNDEDKFAYSEFQKFILEHGKNYTSIEEMTARFEIFKMNLKNLKVIEEEEDTEDVDENKYSEFMDMTEEEFDDEILEKALEIEEIGTKANNITTEGEDLDTNDEDITEESLDDENLVDVVEENKEDKEEEELKVEESKNLNQEGENAGKRNLQLRSEIPSSWDWRTQGAVTKVKHQGGCGACWAFAAAGHIEGLYYLKNRVLKDFSIQQMIDCSKRDNGCHSGMAGRALEYIRRTKGLQFAEDYPYIRRQARCKYNPNLAAANVITTKRLESYNEEYIKKVLYKYGPLPIAINATKFMYYRGGIMNYSNCNPRVLNHAVLLVGYGSKNGQDYWIMKNTWGSSWGEGGYFRVARGVGMCGLNRYIVRAVLA